MGRVVTNSTVRGVLVARHLLLGPGDHIVRGDLCAGLEDDVRLDLLAVAVVGDADDGGERNGIVAEEDFFDLTGGTR